MSRLTRKLCGHAQLLVAVVAIVGPVFAARVAACTLPTANVSAAIPAVVVIAASVAIATAALRTTCSTLTGGADRHAALGAFARAFGSNTFVFGESHVHEPTVGGRHRIESHRSSTRDRSLGHAVGEDADLLLSTIAVLLNVDDDRSSVVFTTTEDDVGYVLKRAQRFAAPTDDQSRVLALDVDDGRVIRAGARASDRGRDIHVHRFQKVFDYAEGGACSCRGAGDQRYANLRGLGPDAQDTPTALANDVYLDLVAAYAELEYRQLDRLVHRLARSFQRLFLHQRQAPCLAGLR